MNRRRNLISIIVVLALIFNTFVFAPKAEAFNLFRSLRRVTRFVLNVPYKATRWMGPKLGPVAGTILSHNLMGHHKLGKIFHKAQKVDKTLGQIQDVEKQLSMTKKVYGDQAKQLRDRAQSLKEARDNLSQKLVEEKGYTFADFKRDAVALDELIEVHERAAAHLENRSKNMGAKDVIKLLGENIFKTALSNMEGVILKEVDKELEKFVDAEAVISFLASGGEGLDTVLEFLVEREMEKALGEDPDLTDEQQAELLDRIKTNLKAQLRQQADYLKKNWDQHIQDILQEEARKSGLEVKKLGEQASEQDQGKEEEDKRDEGSASKGTGYECDPGYEWSPQSGVGCIQANCNDITHAHWSYEGYCVCGSSGSMFEDPSDPNKECAYGPDKESCAGCVYACVHLDEECPQEP